MSWFNKYKDRLISVDFNFVALMLRLSVDEDIEFNLLGNRGSCDSVDKALVY